GDGTWESDNDTLVKTISNLSLSDGIQKIVFSDGNSNLRISANNSKTYFIVVELTSNAASQTPNTFQVTFDPDDDSLNEDRTEDTSICVADSSPTTSENVEAVPEFSTLFLASGFMIILFMVFRRKRRNKEVIE
ncbi:MAG: hypothetical protein KAU14_03110, partial [Thermoplasmata archaeon]|nr:hypothetical protein [Thermoplasmata archaeon]